MEASRPQQKNGPADLRRFTFFKVREKEALEEKGGGMCIGLTRRRKKMRSQIFFLTEKLNTNNGGGKGGGKKRVPSSPTRKGERVASGKPYHI